MGYFFRAIFSKVKPPVGVLLSPINGSLIINKNEPLYIGLVILLNIKCETEKEKKVNIKNINIFFLLTIKSSKLLKFN